MMEWKDYNGDKHVIPDTVTIELKDNLTKAYDIGYQRGFNEGYQAGLQYAIEKAKEHLGHGTND